MLHVEHCLHNSTFQHASRIRILRATGLLHTRSLRSGLCLELRLTSYSNRIGDAVRTGQRAVNNAAAAVKALDKSTVDGKEIRVALSRAADDKEFTRYGDY